MTRARILRRSPAVRMLAGGMGAAALLVAAATNAHAAASSTTVTPAGDAFRASQSSGATAEFSLGNITISCAVATTDGTIDAEPGNANPAGAVTGSLTDPAFTDCTTGLGVLLRVTVTTNHDNGAWGVSLQHDPAGPTAALLVPKGGVVVKTSGIASCTVTVAPDGAASVPGTWTNGDGTTLPQLAVDQASVPVAVSGSFLCPSEATSTFTATYDVTDTTDPSRQISVGA
jgi:hypothetical protein